MALGRLAVTVDVSARVGPLELETPLVAASGTVGSAWEFARVADLAAYGAVTIKSVSAEPWEGRPVPRLAPAGVGMLNGVGIQNPGIEAWVTDIAPRLHSLTTPVWGSAVGKSPEEFALVSKGLESAGLAAVEINLSCPNLEDGRMFALDPGSSGAVVTAVTASVDVPVGAKLSPNAEDIVAVASACAEAGAAWVTLTNTAWGAGIDIETRRPLLSGEVGGYSGQPLKPIALRCVREVAQALPELPIVGCGGVMHGKDVIEYLMAGASAVALGTIHFAEPRAGRRVLEEVERWCSHNELDRVNDLVGSVRPW